jgi:hypothetical protein
MQFWKLKSVKRAGKKSLLWNLTNTKQQKMAYVLYARIVSQNIISDTGKKIEIESRLINQVITIGQNV